MGLVMRGAHMHGLYFAAVGDGWVGVEFYGRAMQYPASEEEGVEAGREGFDIR